MGSNGLHKRAFVGAILIGLLPAWMVLLPLDITSEPEVWQAFVRGNAFAVPIAQLGFVFIAMSMAFSPARSVVLLPNTTKAALLVWVIVAAIVSFQPEKDHFAAIVGLFRLMISGLFLLALVNLRNMAGPRFLLTLWIALGLGALAYVALWMIHIFVTSPVGPEWIYRIPGVNNVRHTGHFAIASIMAGLFTFISFRRSRNVWLRWALPLLFGSVGLGIALWTGSRGPLLASVVIMFVTICVATHHRKQAAGFCLAIALAATATVASLPVPHEKYGIAGATGMADMSAGAESDVDSGRAELWAGTVAKIAERPWLGWGVNQFGKFRPQDASPALHPHNFPLQFLFSGGIISVLLLAAMIFPAFRQRRWPYTQGPSAAAVGGVIGLLVYSLYDGVLYFSYPIMVFMIAVMTSMSPASTKPDRGMSN